MDRKKTVSLCMIVKNEEKFLEKCLDSVKEIVDEMIIVDTGSTDNTINIANAFGAKVINNKWNNNFSEARNISLEEASKEWILIMDADDIFEKSDIDRLIELINNGNKIGYFFDVLSYVLENNRSEYIYSSSIRLLKNIGEYEFKGAIHEQITHKFQQTDYGEFDFVNIRIHHNGYLPSINEGKRKGQRNIAILKEELIKYPNSPFQNYNIANEYLAQNDYIKALEHYNIAFDNISHNSRYFNKLILKRILPTIELRKYEKAIVYIDEGMKNFPDFTELYFYKALVYKEQKRYTLAIKCLNKCVQMGESPAELKFLSGCATFKSYCALGDIYLELKDYEEAISNYEKAIEENNKDVRVYYKLAFSASKYYKNDKDIVNCIVKFLDVNNKEDIFLLSKILMENKIYEYAMQYLLLLKKEENSDRAIINIAKVFMYQNNYETAIELLGKIPKSSIYIDEAIVDSVIIEMILKKDITLEEINEIKDSNKKIAVSAVKDLYIDKETKVITKNVEGVLNEVINILEILINTKEFDIFERILPVLNYIESDKVLLELAKLYDRNGFNELAKDEVLRSVKELNSIDKDGIKILYYLTSSTI